jgi:taurine dioxygenase
MAINILPAGAPVGAEIRGVDLSQSMGDAAFEAVETAFNEHGVVFFRGQSLSPEGLLGLTGRFGEIAFNVFGEDHGLPDYPGVVLISNIEEDGRDIGVKRAGARWHSDMCYSAKPPRGTILCAREVPEQDGLVLGDTCFAATHTAYDDLPDELKAQIEGRKAIFDFAGRERAQVITAVQRERFPAVTHPIVRIHPHTGRKCLYVMRDDCTGIVDMEDGAAQQLIAALADHIIRPEYIYRHRWQAGDVLLWDNCTVQHLAIQDYALPLRRLMHRTTFAAEASPA